MKIKNPDNFRKNVAKELNKIFKNDKKSSNLEKGIYNYAIQEGKKKKIIRKWDNIHFSQLYTDKFRSIYINLKNEKLLERVTKKNLKFIH